MKKLEIVVRSEKLDDVKSILDECESTGAMVSNIMGYGNQKGYKTTYRGSEYVVNLIPKVKIETIAADDVADKIIFKVCERISTGKIGDGKIFVYTVDKVVKIRGRCRSYPYRRARRDSTLISTGIQYHSFF